MSAPPTTNPTADSVTASVDNRPRPTGPAVQGETAAMDPAVTTIQPGGGVVMSIELAGGRVRRWLLRTSRRGYMHKMQATRQGERGPLPFDPVDPRDVKYFQNQPTYWWSKSDDPFSWRDSLPFVRAGLAELVLIGGGFILLAIVFAWLWWPAAAVPLVLAGLVVWFFRNPQPEIPADSGAVVSPADGKLVQIENLDVTLEPVEQPQRKYRIRQITGQFARRIVCWVKPGDLLGRGEMYGMIKLGSRTELIIPHESSLQITAKIGDKVTAGTTVLAQYRDQ